MNGVSMSSESQNITSDNLILKGLEGKDRALAEYDQILWKIRTGYAAVLYGVFTLVVSLSDNTQWHLSTERAGMVALALTTGFTISIAALDFSFLCSKYRVVQAKEELVKLALSLASGMSLDKWTGTPLLTLLYNSGEGRAKVRWKGRPSRWPIALIYLGTWGPVCLAIILMVTGIQH
jgi:hypothetical protein